MTWAMYYFIFETEHHTGYRGSTINQRKIIKGHMNLRNLNKIFKDRYQIGIYSAIPFHSELITASNIVSTFSFNNKTLKDRVNGHVLMLSNEEDAVYVKMHPQYFCRGKTKVTNVYKDLDIQLIRNECQKIFTNRDLVHLSSHQVSKAGYIDSSLKSMMDISSYDSEIMEYPKIAKTNIQHYLQFAKDEKERYTKLVLDGGTRLVKHLEEKSLSV